jgi:hypothetical protein
MKLRISLSWILFLFFVNTQAQVAPVQSNYDNWQQLSSDNFDILYLPSNRALATKTARYAEIALQEISELFDYNPQARYSLFLVYDEPLLAMTHLMLDEAPLDPGYFKIGQKHAFVSYPGTSAKLFGAVKTQVARLLLTEFSYGKRMKQTIQGQALLNYAPWYAQGMAEYVGNGWSYEDEMWLNTLASDHIEEILDMTLEGEGTIPTRLRKSVWRYIGNEYGDQKIAEIIYFVNISGSLEAGIISVLGITLNTLTGRWRENLREIATSNSSGRNGLGKMPNIQEIPLPRDQELLQFAYHPDNDQYALYLNKGGKHQVLIYSAESKQFTATPIVSSQTNPVTGSSVSYPLAWSKDGSSLFTTVYEGKKYKMVWYDAQSKKARSQSVPGHIHHIQDADWAHNGRLLTVSALHGSSPQIFILKVNENEFIPVTDDPFDNIQPSWSYDDETIFFSSNRDTNLIKVENRKLDSRNMFFDVYSYGRAEKADTLIQQTFTPETNEFKPLAPNSFELIYLTDESGIFNLKKKNIILNQDTYLTDVNTGMLTYQAFEAKLVFSTPIKGKAGIFSCRLDAIPAQALPELSLLRTERLTQYAQARRELEEIKRREALLSNASQKPETQNTKPETPNSKPEVQDSNTEKPQEEKKVRYYIFDDYEEPYEVKEAEKNIFEKREKELNQQKQSLLAASLPSKVPNYEDIKVGQTQTPQKSWNIDHLSFEVGRRPDAGLFTRLGGKISDRFHNQEIEAYAAPFVDFRNFNGRNGQFQFKYTNLKHRIDYYVGTDLLVRHYRRINTLFPLDSAIYRYDNLAIQAGARYPLSNYSAVNLEGSFHFLDRRDQKLLNQVLADQSDRVVKLGASYEYDKTFSQESYIYKGWKGEASLNTYYSVAQGASLFSTAAFSVAKYTEIKNRIVLANKLVGGYSFGNRGQRFYIGGTEDWIPPYIFFSDNDARLSKENALQTDLIDFSFQEFITPMRGFWFYSRSGSRYFALSSELRIPISRLTKTSLNSSPLYNLEVIPFVDVGSVWSSGNPFSSTNPTDTRLVGTEPVIVVLRTLRSPFVIGVGSGVRTNFLGYSIRVDLGWGIEDAVVEKLAISLSLGRNF